VEDNIFFVALTGLIVLKNAGIPHGNINVDSFYLNQEGDLKIGSYGVYGSLSEVEKQGKYKEDVCCLGLFILTLITLDRSYLFSEVVNYGEEQIDEILFKIISKTTTQFRFLIKLMLMRVINLEDVC
jgi:hypothetical protein